MDIPSEIIAAKSPLSAHELAERMCLPLGRVLEELHRAWWTIIPITGDWTGWKYAIRPVVNTRNRMIKEVKEYSNSATLSRYQTT